MPVTLEINKKKKLATIKERKSLDSNESKNTSSRQAGSKVADTETLAHQICSLAQTMSGLLYYPYQVEASLAVIESLLKRDGETLTELFSRQSGKSTGIAGTTAAIAIGFPFLAQLYPDNELLNYTDDDGRYRGFKNGLNIGIYAPSKAQATETLEKMRQALSTEKSEAILEELGVQWDVNNGTTVILTSAKYRWSSRIVCESASKNAKIESKNHHLILVEECQDMDDRVLTKSIRPMASSHNGTIVYIGTCGFTKCMFLKQIRKNISSFSLDGKKRHFYYPYNVCVKYNPFYAKFVEDEKETLGEDSDAFRVSYKLEWILERGMFITEDVLTRHDIADQYSVFSLIHENDKLIPPQFSIVAGIDFAKKSDSTVVTVGAVNWRDPIIDKWIDIGDDYVRYRAFEKHIIGWYELQGEDYETQFNRIYAYLSKFKRLCKIVPDATGVGDAMSDRFKAQFQNGSIKVEDFVFSPKSKSEGYKLFITDLLSNRFSFPFSDLAKRDQRTRRFMRQILDAEKDYKENGVLSVAAPEDPDAHDDYPDSAMLCCRGMDIPIDDEDALTHHDLNLYSRV